MNNAIVNECFLVLPLVMDNLESVGDRVYLVNVPAYLDINQIYLCETEKSATIYAKKLVQRFGDLPILIFKCLSVVESTGQCPFVMKSFTPKGELLPVEFFNG